ncbi:hypothetical protein H4S07_007173, partial [Coemansia furcata]
MLARHARLVIQRSHYMTSATASTKSTTRRRPGILAIDFDETLTTHYTLPSVVAVAKQKHQSHRLDFQWFTNEYTRDLEAYEAKWQSTIGGQATSTGWNPSLLNAYLEGLRPIEAASLERLSTHRILAGVSRTEFHMGGASVELRPGAASFINMVLNDPMWRVWVVSVNWSEDFIRGALEAAGVNFDRNRFGIYCNNPAFAPDTGLSTGQIEPRVVVARDKVDLLVHGKHDVQREQGDVPLLVYAGDSLTDLPALLAADIGFLFGKNK